jgi:hypothetical protein
MLLALQLIQQFLNTGINAEVGAGASAHNWAVTAVDKGIGGSQADLFRSGGPRKVL